MKTKFATGFLEAVNVDQTFKTQFNQQLDGVDTHVTNLSQKIAEFLNAYASLPSDGEIPTFDPSGMNDQGNENGRLGIQNNDTDGANLSEPTITSYFMAPSNMKKQQVIEKYGKDNYITIDNEQENRTEFWIKTNDFTAAQVSNSPYYKTEADIDQYKNDVKLKKYRDWFEAIQHGKPIIIGNRNASNWNSNYYNAKGEYGSWRILSGNKDKGGLAYGDTVTYHGVAAGLKNRDGYQLYIIKREGDNRPLYVDGAQLKELANKYGSVDLIKYDTGGYTGSWGPEGRIAMLHQKEIVLNAHDTENFLTAIEIVRSIATQLENNALRTAQGLGSLVTAAAVNNNREVLEQNVTIHAEFPNATNHNEIELAFNDLINQASQYVNRR